MFLVKAGDNFSGFSLKLRKFCLEIGDETEFEMMT